MLEKLLKDMKKNAQKGIISGGAATLACQKGRKNRSTAEASATEFLEATKESMSFVTEDIGGTMKGAFASQAKDALANQGTKLSDL
ncbi:hypothetical protein [Enterococcus sp. BWR-S5]|uniref:hypothetical protein n=1 Tax=Enterococcus sp. BWR-S5 TaxID=2787714 RepID=UPI001923F5F6|nr:hypothetical protein [Enterococcus sp. BWR-S5]MBL1227606.1 hypothetical protein [Enterococcus sp. BWR-S5]